MALICGWVIFHIFINNSPKMRVKLFFIFLLLGTNLGYSQIKFIFNQPKNNIPTTIFPIKSDTIVVVNFQKLNKTTLQYLPDAYKINLMPKNYSWTADVRKAESLKNMALEIRMQDLCGRDLPINIHQEVIQQVYLNTSSNP